MGFKAFYGLRVKMLLVLLLGGGWAFGVGCLFFFCKASLFLDPPNYPLIYPKHPQLRAIETLLKGSGGGIRTDRL